MLTLINCQKQNTVALYIGMMASTVIAVTIRSWLAAPAVCNILPILLPESMYSEPG